MNMTKRILSRIVRRIDRDLEGPTSNFVEQFRYGHREILIAYAGHQGNLALKGSLEHGWSPFGPSLGVPKFPASRYLHLAWSSHNMRRNAGRYPSNVVAVGAPFLYLTELVSRNAKLPELPQENKYLFIPPHGSEVDTPRVDSLIEAYANDFDPKQTTVLMYWTEFLNQKVVKHYIDSGFKVTSAGFCGMSLNEGLGVSTRQRAMSGMGGRNTFLVHVLKNLLSHEEVIAGTIGTSTLYAGYLKKKVTLIKGWDSYETSFISIPGRFDFSADPFMKFLRDSVADKYFSSSVSNVDSFQIFCSQELGKADLFTPTDLHKLIADNSFDIITTHAVDELISDIARLWS